MSTLDKATVEKLAEHLENAELNAQAVTKITDDYPDMDWEDAYDIQWEIRRRKEARGNRLGAQTKIPPFMDSPARSDSKRVAKRLSNRQFGFVLVAFGRKMDGRL